MMLSGVLTSSAALESWGRSLASKLISHHLDIKPVVFSDPESLVAPDKAASPSALWPVSFDERRSVSAVIQEASASLSYLAASTATAAGHRSAHPPLFSAANMATAAECCGHCTMHEPTLVTPQLPTSSLSPLASTLIGSISARLVTVQPCPTLRDVADGAAAIHAAFGQGCNLTTVQLLSSQHGEDEGECSAAICASAAGIKELATTTATAKPQLVLLVVDEQFLLRDDVGGNTSSSSSFVNKMLFTLLTAALQAHIARAIRQQATSGETSNNNNNNKRGFSPQIRIAALVLGSNQLAVAKLVDHFEQIVALVGTPPPPAPRAADQQEQPAPEFELMRAATFDEFSDAVVQQVGEWYAAMMTEDDASREDANRSRACALVVVSAHTGEGDDCVALLHKLRGEYSTEDVVGAVWSPLGGLRHAMHVHSVNDDSSNNNNNNSATTLSSVSASLDLLIISDSDLRRGIAANACLRAFLLQRRITLLVANSGRSLQLARTLLTNSNNSNGTSKVVQIAMNVSNTGNSRSTAASSASSLFFSTLEQTELLLTSFASGSTSQQQQLLYLPRALVPLCPEAVRVLLLSGAAAIGNKDMAAADRNAFFAAARQPLPQQPQQRLSSGLLLFDIDSVLGAATASFALRLLPLGRVVSQTSRFGLGLIEWRLAVSLSALGLRQRVTASVLPIWAARIMRQTNNSATVFGPSNSNRAAALSQLHRCLVSMCGTTIGQLFQQQSRPVRADAATNSAKEGDEDPLFKLCSTFASYPFTTAVARPSSSSSSPSFDTSKSSGVSRPIVEALLLPAAADEAATSSSLVHVMMSSSLSSRMPVFLSNSNASQQQQLRGTSSKWDTSSIPVDEGIAAITATSGRGGAASTTTATTLHPLSTANNNNSSSKRAVRTRRPQHGAMVVDTAVAAQAAESVATTARVPTMAFPGVSSVASSSSLISSGSGSGSSEPWCAMVPDMMSSVMSRGEWLAVPADCTTALIAIKSCFRTFCDNALFIVANNSQQQQALLPQMAANFLSHAVVKRLLAAVDNGSANNNNSGNNATTIGAWVELQLKKNTLKRSGGNSNNNNDDAAGTAPTAVSASSGDSAAKLRATIQKACGAVLCGVAVRRQRDQQQPNSSASFSSAAATNEAAAAAPAFAPFVGHLPPQNVRELIDSIAPKVQTQGLEKVQTKLKGNPATAFVVEGHQFHPYFVWAIATFSARMQQQQQQRR